MATARRTRTRRTVTRKRTTPVVEEEPEVQEEDLEEELEDEEPEEEPAPAPKRKRGRPRKSPPPEPEPEEDEEEEDEEEEDEEEEEPAPPKRRRGRPRKTPPPEPEEDEDEDEDEEDEEDAPAPRSRRVRRKAKQVEEEEVEEEEEEVQQIVKTSAAGAMDIFQRLLDSGRTIVMTRVKGQYIFSSGGVENLNIESSRRKTRGRGHRPSAMTLSQMEEIATTDEYKEYDKWWKTLTFEEKVAAAKKAKAEWEPHDHPLTHNLRVSMAYQAAKGIEKWKPQYSTTKARDALRYDGIEIDDEDFEYEDED